MWRMKIYLNEIVIYLAHFYKQYFKQGMYKLEGLCKKILIITVI